MTLADGRSVSRARVARPRRPRSTRVGGAVRQLFHSLCQASRSWWAPLGYTRRRQHRLPARSLAIRVRFEGTSARWSRVENPPEVLALNTSCPASCSWSKTGPSERGRGTHKACQLHKTKRQQKPKLIGTGGTQTPPSTLARARAPAEQQLPLAHRKIWPQLPRSAPEGPPSAASKGFDISHHSRAATPVRLPGGVVDGPAGRSTNPAASSVAGPGSYVRATTARVHTAGHSRAQTTSWAIG